MSKEKQTPVRLARLTKSQRDFITRRVMTEMKVKLNKKIERHPSVDYLQYAGKYEARLDVHFHGHELSVFADSELDTCVDAKARAERVRKDTELPDVWYRQQYDAGNFTLVHEMPECAIRPKLSIKWTNEAKALKAAQTKAYNTAMRRIKKLHKSRVVLRDELRVDVMEFNKWVYEVLEPELMLTLDGANALERVMAMMPKPL